MGKIAYVDLSKGKVEAKEIPEKVRKMFIGGRGIDMYLLYNHTKQGIDPMGPENVLLVSAGLLVGTPAPGAGRCHVGGKSPITNCVGSTNMGGFFTPELRYAGFDHLVIKGKAEKPVYLMIRNGRIEIKDASQLWGKDTYDTPRTIREVEGDEEIKVMCIGIAGENLVRYANVRTGPKNSGGRTGMGAVMGSKNLKAIAVRGTGGVEVKYPQEALEYYKKITSQILRAKGTKQFSKYGTPMILRTTGPIGVFRVRNFQKSQMTDSEPIMPEEIDKVSLGMTACFGCSVHCRGKYRADGYPEGKNYAEGPEYAVQGSIGCLLDCNDLSGIMTAYHELNLWGEDVVEASGLIAYAMELYQRGIIGDEVTGGLKLEWGNTDVIREMYRRIAYREGFGDVLADGMEKAIERLGEETRYYGLSIKGLACIGSDERATPALALGVATATRGADHLRSRPTIDFFNLPGDVLKKIFLGGPISSDFTSFEGKAYEIYFTERLYALVDALGICKFQTRAIMSPTTPAFEEYSPLIYNITGMKFSPADLMNVGERIYTIERMFNIREGRSRKDDYLPDRYYLEKTPETGGLPLTRGVQMERAKFDKMLDEYYELHHWDKDGNPLPERLEELGLDKEPSHML